MVTRLVAVPDASGYPRLQAESVTSRALMPGDLLQVCAGALSCSNVLDPLVAIALASLSAGR